MLAAFVTKLLFPGVPLIVVVPDLVRHSFRGSGKLVTLRKALRIAEDYIVGALSRQVDGFVLLTSDMRDHFAVGVPYLILEAIYPMQPDWESDTSEDETEFVYTYCGKLTRENGVDRLLKAFACLDYSDIRLHICGSGPMESYVQEQAERDSRIVYFGNVSHDRVLAIEKGSTVLVNPRYTYLPNAGLSFPSKLVEYLACGRPVISSRLRGIPSEYDAYLFAIKDDSASALASVMQYVHSKDRSELMQVGAENRRFVRHEKSTSAQGMRLFRFIESVIAISKR
jgi:glycosyltransferase involved in cell wall biosynthesis